MKKLRFRKVWVNHPDMPSNDPRSRGRKTHLALSNKPGTASLCNMTVAGQFIGNMYNGLCEICKFRKDKI